MKTILSGVKPTGDIHLGNYFGAIKQWLELQESHNCYFMVADYHALNFIQDGKKMHDLTQNLIIDYIACGLDPEKVTLFKQSDISEHTELAWIFDTITTVPYLKRAHAYKDAMAKGGEEDISVGTFNYPMLMAADILLYSPDLVPVGLDQRQHIEFARDTAEKFNRIFGSTSLTTSSTEDNPILKIPEEYIVENVETVPGTDGRKMSKSYGNTIPLFASDEEIEKAVMSIVTDSSGDYPENVYNIHKLFVSNDGSTSLTADKLEKIYQENKGKYKILKEALIEDIKAFIKPLRERREEIAKNPELIKEALEKGKEKARVVARAKMETVKKAIGVL